MTDMGPAKPLIKTASTPIQIVHQCTTGLTLSLEIQHQTNRDAYASRPISSYVPGWSAVLPFSLGKRLCLWQGSFGRVNHSAIVDS